MLCYRSNTKSARVSARVSVLSRYFLTRSHDDLLGSRIIIDSVLYEIIRLEPVEYTGEVLVRLRNVLCPLLIRKTSLHLLAALVS